jgi:ATP-dependent Clp protease ATP-binding subunit ClpA
MQLANQEAHRFNHEYIGTEHILLALVREGEGVAAVVLRDVFEIDLRKIRLEIEKILESAPYSVLAGSLPLTPGAKKVIEYSIEELRNLKHNYVGTEHLLLGLVRAQESVAAQVLINLGLKLEDVRREVVYLVGRDPAIYELCIQTSRAKALADELRDLPETAVQAIKELDTEIERIRDEKEAKVAEQDFEEAAWLFDQERKLRKKRETLIREGREKL